MRHDSRRAWPGTAAVAVAAVASLLSTSSASAQTLLRGVAEIQYQNLDELAAVNDRESWARSFRTDFSTKIRRTIEISSQIQFSEQTVTGRPDRTRIPRASLNIAHPLFGFLASYRPITTTDGQNITTKQQELMLSGYLQKAHLPRVVGSWTRRHLDPNSTYPGSASVTRTLSASYDIGRLGFHAGYGDQSREAGHDGGQQPQENHYSLGSIARLQWRHGTGSAQYDFTQARRWGVNAASDLTRAHAASVNGTYQFSHTTAANLAYSFRRSDSSRRGSAPSTENDGALTIGHQLSKVFQISSAGGVRTASFGQTQETESYVTASLSADAVARPGWRVSSGASHSVNWLPGDRGRAVESFTTNTTMRLANGLDASGDVTLSSSAHPAPTPEGTSPPGQVTLSSGGNLRAIPLRAIMVNAAARHYRTGTSLFGGGPSTDSRSVDLQLRPSERFHVAGSWALSSNPGTKEPDRTIERAEVQWDPSRSLSASGNYTRSSGGVRDPATLLPGSRDAYGARLIAAVTRDMRLTIQYSETDPGLSSHARQIDVSVTQSFGR